MCAFTQPNSVACRLSMYPEGHPWQHHYEDARHIHLDKEVASVSLEIEVHLQNGELTYTDTEMHPLCYMDVELDLSFF